MPDWSALFRDARWRNLHWLWLSLLVLVSDLWTKRLVESSLSLYQRIEVLPFFNITLAYNPGAAFSFLAGAGGWQRWFLSLVAMGASLFIFFWLIRLKGERLLSLGLALILGGALGNLWDRLVYGHVTDFLDFHWAGWHFPAFNIADTAITLGAACLIIDMIFFADKGKQENA